MTHFFYNIVLITKHPLGMLVIAAILAAITIWKMPKPVPLTQRFFIYALIMTYGLNTLTAYIYQYLMLFIGMAAFTSDKAGAFVAPFMMGITGMIIQFLIFLTIAWLTLKGFAKTWAQLYDH
ncbi:hypothetical protein [Marinicella sp. W31]|uniref:hypothetical protein n=1 Tax=Marinicella sp. W31 TaxID=3023713 RepID=UPI003756FEA3